MVQAESGKAKSQIRGLFLFGMIWKNMVASASKTLNHALVLGKTKIFEHFWSKRRNKRQSWMSKPYFWYDNRKYQVYLIPKCSLLHAQDLSFDTILPYYCKILIINPNPKQILSRTLPYSMVTLCMQQWPCNAANNFFLIAPRTKATTEALHRPHNTLLYTRVRVNSN